MLEVGNRRVDAIVVYLTVYVVHSHQNCNSYIESIDSKMSKRSVVLIRRTFDRISIIIKIGQNKYKAILRLFYSQNFPRAIVIWLDST